MASGGLFADEEDEAAKLDAFAAELDAESSAAEGEEITPRSNPDLFGHEAVEEGLLADFNTGRMPHAIILAGLPGIGKETLAYRLARFLLTQGDQQAGLFGEPEKPTSLYVAPDHAVFRRVASGGHADLLTIQREYDEKKGRMQTEIPVETVRRINAFVRKTAAENGWRAIIVNQAEDLNRNSQNALLKILEEPPQKTVLILTTSQPGGFLPTIRSRCRMIHMNPLPESVSIPLLDKFCPGLSAEQKSGLSRLAEGSLGKAILLHQNNGLELYKSLLALVSTLPDLNLEAVHAFAEKHTKEEVFGSVRDILTSWAGRLARLEARGQAITDIMEGDATVFQNLLNVYPPRHFLYAWEKIAQMFRTAENLNLDNKQAILQAFLMLQKPDYAGPAI